jgi:hypothetical protein
MDARVSFSHYYRQLIRQSFKNWYHSWKNELYAHTALSLITWLVTRKDHDACEILKVALEANAILLIGVAIMHFVRAPWLRDAEQIVTINTIQGALSAEEQKNGLAEIKGNIEKTYFDISYDPKYLGPLLVLEINLWNNRQVATTIRKVSLKVLTIEGYRFSTIEQPLQNVQIGATRLDYLLGKIWPQNPLRYNIHENGWLLFYVEGWLITDLSHTVTDVTLHLEFMDASGMTHVLEQTRDLQRCNLQVLWPGNVLSQFRIKIPN